MTEEQLEIEFNKAMLEYITQYFKEHKEDRGILKVGEACRDLGIKFTPYQLDMERKAFLRARDADNNR